MLSFLTVSFVCIPVFLFSLGYLFFFFTLTCLQILVHTKYERKKQRKQEELGVFKFWFDFSRSSTSHSLLVSLVLFFPFPQHVSFLFLLLGWIPTLHRRGLLSGPATACRFRHSKAGGRRAGCPPSSPPNPPYLLPHRHQTIHLRHKSARLPPTPSMRAARRTRRRPPTTRLATT